VKEITVDMVKKMEPEDLLEKLNELKLHVMNLEQDNQEKQKALDEERVKNLMDNTKLKDEVTELMEGRKQLDKE